MTRFSRFSTCQSPNHRSLRETLTQLDQARSSCTVVWLWLSADGASSPDFTMAPSRVGPMGPTPEGAGPITQQPMVDWSW